MKNLLDILPVYGVEHDAILSKMGDITVAFKVELPELFTMSNDDYEAFHHSWIKAIKVYFLMLYYTNKIGLQKKNIKQTF